MTLCARSAFDFFSEISRSEPGAGPPLGRDPLRSDLVDLVDEAFVSAVLADELPARAEDLDIVVTPIWEREPFVEAIEVSIDAPGSGGSVRRRFRSGRWMRRAQAKALELAADGGLEAESTTYVCLVAEGLGRDEAIPLPGVQAPSVTVQSLEELGVVRLGDEPLCPHRPVLVNRRMVDEVLEETEAAGATETGGAVIGKLVRLEQPLPKTTTRVVTVLSEAVSDPRHVRSVGSVTFDPSALAHAAHVAALRQRGECVLTAYHSHGWGEGCGRCNRNPDCVIPSASFVSLDDYQVLESLFPSKSTVMPIAGRKLGAPGDRPVLEIHAWSSGRMESIPWATYSD